MQLANQVKTLVGAAVGQQHPHLANRRWLAEVRGYEATAAINRYRVRGNGPCRPSAGRLVLHLPDRRGSRPRQPDLVSGSDGAGLDGHDRSLLTVSRVDDAKAAVDAGVTAISVSNHGGNNLDGTPATIRVLPAIAEAVGDDIEILLDGGIRRGSDVVKALALGARAVMIGRAYLWGLAANGQAGVENVLDILRGGIDSALLGLGRTSIHELTPGDLVVPPGFERVLGQVA